jgi:site-specific DNA-methyltransferase (adenine-specific)
METSPQPHRVYHEEPHLRLFHGDAAKHGIPGTYDVIFADPPYNLNRAYGPECPDNLPQSDYDSFTYNWMHACLRLLKPGGTFWVVINPDQLFSVLLAARSLCITRPHTNAPYSHCIWHYRFGQHTHHNFINSHAHVLRFCCSHGPNAFTASAVLEPSDRATISNDKRTTIKAVGKPGERMPFTVWQDGEYRAVPDGALSVWQGDGFSRITGNNKERSHPHDNQLPVALVRRCLQVSTPINEPRQIFDPFVGSGTTAVAARQLGHSFTGLDISEPILTNALKRIRRDV